MQGSKFGTMEAIAMTTIFVMADIFAGFPAKMADLALQAAWLATAVAVFGGFLGALVLAVLMQRYPGKTIIQVGRQVLGPVAGFLFSLLLFLFFLLIAVTTLRQYAMRIQFSFLDATPVDVIMILLLCPAILALRIGLESIARTSLFIFPSLIAAVVVPLLLTVPNWNIHNLFPFWGPGILKVAVTGMEKSSIFAQLVVMALFYPAVELGQDRPGRVWVTAMVLLAPMYLFSIIVFELLYPVPVANEILSPMYQIVKEVFLTRFVQRLELLIIIFWVITLILKLTIAFFGAAVALTQGLGLPYSRPLIYPLASLIFVLAALPASFSENMQLITNFLWVYGWIPGFAAPLLLLVLSKLMEKRKGKGP